MTAHSSIATIETACLIRGDLALLNTSIDSLPQGDWDFSRVSTYEFTDEINPWGYRDYDWVVVSVCVWVATALRAVLSREGEVRLYGPGGKPDRTYQVPEAGVFGEAAAGFGYVNRIRAVGDQLYVCGQSRQVYRFEWDGQDLATGRWEDMAGPMRQPPMPEPPDGTDEEAFDRWLDENDAIDFTDIGGPASNDLYAIGDETWHWDGRTWRQLTLPTDEPLAALKVLNDKELVLVGHNGTVLHGNAQSGFTELSAIEDNQNFTGVEWFDGRLFLASNFGLFVYDPQSKRIAPYATGLKPELKDAHLLEAKDGVLWSFGFKDLAWSDGHRWTRVDHPDNPPIR